MYSCAPVMVQCAVLITPYGLGVSAREGCGLLRSDEASDVTPKRQLSSHKTGCQVAAYTLR